METELELCSLPCLYSVCMGVTRVNEWDNKRVLMVLISQNTYIGVDSAEPYGG